MLGVISEPISHCALDMLYFREVATYNDAVFFVMIISKFIYGSDRQHKEMLCLTLSWFVLV